MKKKKLFKKLTTYWKNITLVLALPLMITNSVLDYYYSWETRELEKQTEKIQKQKDDSFKYHSHHLEDKYQVVIDVDGQEVRLLEHQKGDLILQEFSSTFDFLKEYDEAPQEKVDNILTKAFKPIQNVVGKVTSWFKWHLWEKGQDRKKREDLIERGLRG